MLQKAYADGPHGQVHYVHNGRTGRPPLVLLGPAPRSWRAFEQMFPMLEGFHVIAPDPPCFGESSPVRTGDSMKDVAAGIVAVLDAMALPRAHVYGHNTGRLIAAAMAADWPDRTDRLIVAGPTFTLIPEQDVRIDAIRSFIGARYFDVGAEGTTHPALRAWANTYRTMIGPWWWSDALFAADDPATVVEALENRIIDELMARRSVESMYRINFEFDFAEALSRALARTLIIEITGGSADAGGFKRQGARLAACMRDARSVEMRQTEGPIGLFLLTGLQPMAEAIAGFLKESADV